MLCMATQLLSYEVSDLCLGKPLARPLPISATVADALYALHSSSGSAFIAIWSSSGTEESSQCVERISVVDVLCFLCREDHISCPLVALHSPVSHLLRMVPSQVKHLESNSSILEAVNCIIRGGQNFIVTRRGGNKGLKEKVLQRLSLGHQFCWITQEDVIRFFFNSINLFAVIPFYSIQSLNIIEHEIISVHYDDPALSALSAIQSSVTGQTAVAVVDNEGRLVGDISLHTLASCNETIAPAVATLSAGDLMAYIDYGDLAEDLLQLIKARLEERNLNGMLELLEDDPWDSSSSSCLSTSVSSSSDDELVIVKQVRHRAVSRQFVKGTKPLVCYRGSSLVAVMIQALSYRLNYVWVIEEDHSLVGIVTFSGMLKVLKDGSFL